MSSEPDGGKGRDWGYASSKDDGTLTYTSYEKSGCVNRYTDNGDGYHSHEYWKNADDYNSGADPDWVRNEDSKKPNPTVGEVYNNGGCYLTTACMQNYKNNFDDNCYELETLRKFRDEFVSADDVKHYYDNAPIVVESINKLSNSRKIYAHIYDDVVAPCVKAITNKNYDYAYNKYKNTELELEEKIARPVLVKKLVLNLQKIKK